MTPSERRQTIEWMVMATRLITEFKPADQLNDDRINGLKARLASCTEQSLIREIEWVKTKLEAQDYAVNYTADALSKYVEAQAVETEKFEPLRKAQSTRAKKPRKSRPELREAAELAVQKAYSKHTQTVPRDRDFHRELNSAMQTLGLNPCENTGAQRLGFKYHHHGKTKTITKRQLSEYLTEAVLNHLNPAKPT